MTMREELEALRDHWRACARDHDGFAAGKMYDKRADEIDAILARYADYVEESSGRDHQYKYTPAEMEELQRRQAGPLVINRIERDPKPPSPLKHLRYCMNSAFDAGETRHPKAVMRELGISYQHAMPQFIFKQWWFWNCENIPDTLPPYLSEVKVCPFSAVGHGLSRSQAELIKAARVARGQDEPEET